MSGFIKKSALRKIYIKKNRALDFKSRSCAILGTFLFTTNIFALKYWVVWGKKENKILNYKEGEKINPPLPHFF